MRMCEVCGAEQESENSANHWLESRILHVCEKCLQDRAPLQGEEEALS